MKLVVPVLNKFDSDGRLVLDDEYARFIDALIESGVDLLMPNGTNSEFHVMNTEERKKVVEFIFENFKGKVGIMPHVGSASLTETLRLAEHAFSLGADMVSVVAPYYFKYDDRAIVEYFVSLARMFPSKKFLLYNIPSFSGNRLSFKIIREIKERADNVVGIKDTDSRPWIVSKLKGEFGDDFIVYGGLDTLVSDYVMRGADGHVSGTANVFPKILRGILDSFESRDFEKAFELQRMLDEIVENVSGHIAFVGANKYALRLAGFDLGYPRSPSRGLDEDEKKRVERYVSKFKEYILR